MEYTNIGLVKYAEAQLGYGYWYGTYGQIGSASVYASCKKMYPHMYPPRKWTEESFQVQYGQKVHDCSGLIKGYLMTPDADKNPHNPAVYNSKYDWSANGTIEKCTEQGAIGTLPEVAGIIVWKNNHVGIYVGNGEVIEAKGHAYGVVRTKLSDTNWVRWGKHPAISYISMEEYFVTRLYRTVLDRDPDEEGLKFWTGGLKSKMVTPTQCAFSFLTSDEFKSRNLSDSEFLDVLYVALFDRDADPDGKSYWLDYLKTHSRDQVIVCFLNSDEWLNLVSRIYK